MLTTTNFGFCANKAGSRANASGSLKNTRAERSPLPAACRFDPNQIRPIPTANSIFQAA